MGSAGRDVQTPEPESSPKQPGSESKSTRITLNLKTARQVGPNDSSPPASPDGADESLGQAQQDNAIRASVEDGDADMSHASPEPVDASSPMMEAENPPIELIDDEDDADLQNKDCDAGADMNGIPHVTILQDNNPFETFPGVGGELVTEALPKLCSLFLNSEHIPKEARECCSVLTALYFVGHNAANALRGWIDSFVSWAHTRDSDTLHEMYTDHRDFWQMMPHLIWQYSSTQR